MKRRAPVRLAARYRLRGIETVNADLAGRTEDIERVLAAFGARIAAPGVLHGPLILHNAEVDYRNLWIGGGVHLGRGVTLDLTETLQLQGDAVVSMGCTILTHTSTGGRHPDVAESRSATIIGRGAYLGANVTVLPGCDVGDHA